MMIDINLDEVHALLNCIEYQHDHAGLSIEQVAVRDKLYDLMNKLEELDALDFDECEGGACKL